MKNVQMMRYGRPGQDRGESDLYGEEGEDEEEAVAG